MDDDRARSFDRVAEEYDRARSGYPAELVDAACREAGLAPRSRVLEVGCGTGQLTRALVERGLRVEAVEPGAELVRVARRHLGEAVRFHAGRFEDVELPERAYEAVFAAAAFHWVDSAVAWSKAARLLRPGGVLALLNHTFELDPELLELWRQMLPEARTWLSRAPEQLWAGAEERRGNVSELWSWLVKHDLARPEAADLFREARLRTVAVDASQTAEQAVAQLRTQSSYLVQPEERRLRLEQGLAAFVERQGGVYRPRVHALLVTARRT